MPIVPHAYDRRVLVVLLGLMAGPGAAAQAADLAKDAMPTPTQDTYAWLEDVNGAKPLEWVHAQNARTDAELAATPEFARREAGIRAILDSEAKIPEVEKIGPYYYNFWKDAQHERGLWRRTTLDEYRKPAPKWETVIDLDALGAAEGEKWVWHGANCLKPAYERCLVALSRGGSDADVTREFDLSTKQWVKDGFFRPEAKGSLDWIDRDTVFVQTDFGARLHDHVRLSAHRQALASRHAARIGDRWSTRACRRISRSPRSTTTRRVSSATSSAARWISTATSCTCAAATARWRRSTCPIR